MACEKRMGMAAFGAQLAEINDESSWPRNTISVYPVTAFTSSN